MLGHSNGPNGQGSALPELVFSLQEKLCPGDQAKGGESGAQEDRDQGFLRDLAVTPANLPPDHGSLLWSTPWLPVPEV